MPIITVVPVNEHYYVVYLFFVIRHCHHALDVPNKDVCSIHSNIGPTYYVLKWPDKSSQKIFYKYLLVHFEERKHRFYTAIKIYCLSTITKIICNLKVWKFINWTFLAERRDKTVQQNNWVSVSEHSLLSYRKWTGNNNLNLIIVGIWVFNKSLSKFNGWVELNN